MAVTFAFCCLVCSALNDFAFKLFARKERSRGMFIALIGTVWLLLLLWSPGNWREGVGVTLLWGCISGFFSVAGNLLLIEAMGHASVGMCSTIYRLNLVLVVVGAFLFIGETVTPLQLAGVVLALAAILALFPGGGKLEFRQIGFILVVIAAVMRAGMGLSYKYGFLQGADRQAVTLVNSLFWIAGGLLYAAFRERKIVLPDRKMLRYGGLSGVLVAGIVVFMAASLQYGEASIVLPIAQMSFLGTSVLGIFFLKERFGARQAVALCCGTVAILFLTTGG